MRRLVMVCCDCTEASVKLAEYVAQNFNGHDILLTHVHCKSTFRKPFTGFVGGDFEVDRQNALNAEAEKKEMDFVEHILQPRMEALGVKPGQVRSELVRLDSMDSDDEKDVAAALCKRAKELDPELMVLSKHSGKPRPITEFFLGSTTKDCFRHAPCPVLFV